MGGGFLLSAMVAPQHPSGLCQNPDTTTVFPGRGERTKPGVILPNWPIEVSASIKKELAFRQPLFEFILNPRD
jgi:hypothetical protein